MVSVCFVMVSYESCSWCGADIYIAMVSSTHKVCADNIYVAIVSTIVETSAPENEIQPGLHLLGSIYDKYAHFFTFLYSHLF